MKDKFKVVMSLVGAGALGLGIYYMFIVMPNNHAESLRIKAETVCRASMNNIADQDQANWMANCMKNRLDLWK